MWDICSSLLNITRSLVACRRTYPNAPERSRRRVGWRRDATQRSGSPAEGAARLLAASGGRSLNVKPMKCSVLANASRFFRLVLLHFDKLSYFSIWNKQSPEGADNNWLNFYLIIHWSCVITISVYCIQVLNLKFVYFPVTDCLLCEGKSKLLVSLFCIESTTCLLFSYCYFCKISLMCYIT